MNTLIERFSTTNAVLEARVNFDLRPGDQAYISGNLTFKDASLLYFCEFVDGGAGEIEKIMYSYHYQDAEQTLILRYDNAAHQPALTSPDHKHLASGTILENVTPPQLADVLAEIGIRKGWF